MTPLSAPPDSFVTKRNEAYAALFIPGSLEELLAVFSDDVVYSDFSWEALNMDKNALAPFYKYMFDMTNNLKFVTHSINGSAEFTTWEISIKFQAKADDPAHNLKAGQDAEMRGVSLLWWRKIKEGEKGGLMGWKVFRGHDYATPP